MKLMLFVILVFCSQVQAQEISGERGAEKNNSVIIRDDKKPFPYVTIHGEAKNALAVFHVLSEASATSPTNAAIQLEDGQVMIKPVAYTEKAPSDVIGYSEFKLCIPLNESDINLLSESRPTHLYFDNLPVALCEDLCIGIKKEMKSLVEKRNDYLNSDLFVNKK